MGGPADRTAGRPSRRRGYDARAPEASPEGGRRQARRQATTAGRALSSAPAPTARRRPGDRRGGIMRLVPGTEPDADLSLSRSLSLSVCVVRAPPPLRGRGEAAPPRAGAGRVPLLRSSKLTSEADADWIRPPPPLAEDWIRPPGLGLGFEDRSSGARPAPAPPRRGREEGLGEGGGGRLKRGRRVHAGRAGRDKGGRGGLGEAWRGPAEAVHRPSCDARPSHAALQSGGGGGGSVRAVRLRILGLQWVFIFDDISF